ncbi:hypothetical protein ACWD12_30260, partial [Streptodolium elevatio]
MFGKDERLPAVTGTDVPEARRPSEVDLVKRDDAPSDAPAAEEPVEDAAPKAPGWLLWPLRVIAFVVVVPFQLVRGAALAVWGGIKAFGRVLAVPLKGIWRVIAWPFVHLGQALRWCGRTIVWPFRQLWRGLEAVGRGFAWVFRKLGAGLRAVGRGLRRLGGVLAWPFVQLWRGLMWLGGWLARGLVLLGKGLVWPFAQIWRGLMWLGGWLARGLVLLGKGLVWPFAQIWRG